MGRVAKTSTSKKSVTPSRKPGRSVTVAADKAATTAKSMPSKGSKAAVGLEKRKLAPPAKASTGTPTRAATATKPAARTPAPPPASKVSKDELRAQVEKLEQLVTSFRGKSRESNKAAKISTTRITELEAQVAQMEKRIASASAPSRSPGPTKPVSVKRQPREIDPGDAVPPGVAVQDPAPLDEEATTALENLEEHLGQG